MLKEKLLNTKLFVDNEYLDKYLILINSSSNTASSGYYEKHHIIPFCYFSHLLKATTNKQKECLRKKSQRENTKEWEFITKDNIVYLSFYQHCLAHWYLFNCTIDYLKQANEIAFIKMTDRKLNLRNCTEDEVNEILSKIKLLEIDPTSNKYLQNKINDIIFENYPNGYKACQKELLKQLNLSWDRFKIKSRAINLGVKSKNYRPLWTTLEIDILKENYPKYGYKKCLELLPNKNKYTIQSKAISLKLLAPGASKVNAAWTRAEISIIKKYYPIGGVVLCKKYLPNRSEKAIKHQANVRLKVFKNKDLVLTEFDKGITKSIYLLDKNNNILKEFNSIKEAAEYLNYSAAYISCILNKKYSTDKFNICFKKEYDKWKKN